MTLICEKCGEETKQPLTHLEGLEFPNGIKVCWKCKFPIQMRLLISSRCKNHVIGCTCHHCINMRELGYKKKDNKWIKQ